MKPRAASQRQKLLIGRAMLLFGHGAVTASSSMEQSITDMIHLEHQAEMNYYACTMAGPDHPYLSREQVLDFSGGLGPYEQLHFKQAVAKAGLPMHRGV